MSRFLQQRLHIVSGKGGVGKTTVSAALGLLLARAGKRTIVVEVGDQEKLAPLFGHDPVGYNEVELEPNLLVVHIDPFRALQRYLTMKMKIEAAARRVAENQLVRYFTRAAPGFRELMTLGNIMELEQREGKKERKKQPDYDAVVVDAPATGHGLSFLRVPEVVLNTVPVGPIAWQTRRIQSLLSDRERTRLHIVTLPEEMPVNEAIEMCRGVESTLDIGIGWLIANAVRRAPYTAQERRQLEGLREGEGPRAALEAELGAGAVDGLLAASERLLKREQVTTYHLDRLRRSVDYPLIETPYIYREPLDRAAVETLADTLRDAEPIPPIEGGGA